MGRKILCVCVQVGMCDLDARRFQNKCFCVCVW